MWKPLPHKKAVKAICLQSEIDTHFATPLCELEQAFQHVSRFAELLENETTPRVRERTETGQDLDHVSMC